MKCLILLSRKNIKEKIPVCQLLKLPTAKCYDVPAVSVKMGVHFEKFCCLCINRGISEPTLPDI